MITIPTQQILGIPKQALHDHFPFIHVNVYMIPNMYLSSLILLLLLLLLLLFCFCLGLFCIHRVMWQTLPPTKQMCPSSVVTMCQSTPKRSKCHNMTLASMVIYILNYHQLVQHSLTGGTKNIAYLCITLWHGDSMFLQQTNTSERRFCYKNE